MIELGIGFGAVFLALISFLWNKRRDTFTFMEQSFSDLQSINEKILESDGNVKAAISSVCPSDSISVSDAREVFLQYMRINRIFRAWQYQDRKFINEKDAMFIIDAHVGVLKKHESILKVMLQRGYPEEFSDFLLQKVKHATMPEPLCVRNEEMLNKASNYKSTV